MSVIGKSRYIEIKDIFPTYDVETGISNKSVIERERSVNKRVRYGSLTIEKVRYIENRDIYPMYESFQSGIWNTSVIDGGSLFRRSVM